MIISRLPALALLAVLLAACASVEEPAASGERIRADIAFLADDARAGREAGTPGYDAAADFVVRRMKEIGLEPAGASGWFQDVPLRSAVRDMSAARLSLRTDGKATDLIHLEDFIAGRSFRAPAYDISAPLVYAGYGVTAPAEGVDDYAGLDVSGKIVVVFAGAPPTLNTEKRAYYSDSDIKLENAAARGAVGFISMPTKADADKGQWPRIVSNASSAGMTFIDADGGAPAPDLEAGAHLNVSGAGKVFAGERSEYAALQAKEAEGAGAPKGFPLAKTARLAGASTLADSRSANVIGIIKGGDPALADEVILLTAHLDHIDVVKSAAPGEDAINNGALDNASGVAVMLEAARMIAQSGKRPRRTIAFVALTAVEKGLLGSEYLALRPAFGGRRIVANVNLDMPVMLYPFSDIVAFGAERTTIGPVVAKAAKEMGVALAPDPFPEENIFIRSDHYSFVKEGAPAVYLMPGFANGGAEAFGAFLKNNYHRPSDDLSQPIDYEALARFAELNRRIARALADAPSAPAWVDGDFFGEMFAK